MTIKIPQPNILDKLLELLGKKRGVILPTDAYKKHGPHVYAGARRESFLKTLFRSKNEKLPKGVIDINFLHDTDIDKPQNHQ